MIKYPLISVLIPVFNGENVVLNAINSIINQTYENLEIVIVDDCSTDSTYEKISRLKDKRIKIFRNSSNMKIATTLNLGMRICQGKYIARMDADDFSLPDRIMKQFFFLEENPDHLLVGTAYYKIVDGKNQGIRKQVTGYRNLRSKLFFGNNICHPSILINKKIWIANNLQYNNDLRYAQDYDLWTRVVGDLKMDNLTEPLLMYKKFINAPNVEKTKISNENFRKSLINYIQKSFVGISQFKAQELAVFYISPEHLTPLKAFKSYFESIWLLFSINNISKKDFLLRLSNQLYKNLIK